MRYRDREIPYTLNRALGRGRKKGSCCKMLHVAENARTFIMQAIVVGAPLQPFISGSTLAATSVIAANSGLPGLGAGLGVRSGSLYGYGSGSVVKIH